VSRPTDLKLVRSIDRSILINEVRSIRYPVTESDLAGGSRTSFRSAISRLVKACSSLSPSAWTPTSSLSMDLGTARTIKVKTGRSWML